MFLPFPAVLASSRATRPPTGCHRRGSRSPRSSSRAPQGSRRGLAAAALGAASLLLAAPARGAGEADIEAHELAERAIVDDYLQLEFGAAEKKLLRALRLCKKGCSPTIEAQIRRDLAVVYVTGMKRKTKGRRLLIEALRLDPLIALDADLTTPELVRAFERAQKVVSEKQPKREPAAPEPEKPKPAPPGEANAGMSLSAEDCPPDFPGCEALQGPSEDAGWDEEEERESAPEHWVSLTVQQDVLMFSGQSGVCSTGAPEELSCYRSNDEYRDPTNTAGDGGEVSGGFQLATTRVMLGYEHQLLLPNLMVGGQLGYAFGGGPSEPGGASFVPFHVEARGRYSFGALGSLTPYATLGLGLAQVDGSVETDVVDQNPNPLPGQPLVRRDRVIVWKKTGTTFAALGGGVRYPLGRAGALTAQLNLMLLFPSAGTALALQAGYSHGF